MTSLRATAGDGVRWTGAAGLSAAFCQMLSLVILARFFLSPDEFGLAALAFVLAEFATLFRDAGLNQALVHRQQTTQAEESSVFWTSILIGAAIAVVLFFSSSIVAAFFAEPRLGLLIQILSIQFLVQPWGAHFEALLSRDIRFRPISMIDIASTFLIFVSSIAAAWAGYGATSLVIAALVGAAFKATFFLVIGLRRYPVILRLRLYDLAKVAGFSGFYLVDRIVNFLSQRLDQLLLGRLMGAEILGLYNVAFRISAVPINTINPIVTRVAFPIFAKMQFDSARLRSGYIEICGMLAMVNAPIFFGIVAVSPVAVPLVLGASWMPAIPALQLLCAVSLLRGVSNPVGSLLLAKGRTDQSLFWNIGVLVFVVPSLAVGALWGGAVGVAASLLFCQIVLQVPAYFLLVRRLIGPCAGEYVRSFLVPFALAAAMASVVTLIGFILGISWFALATQIVAGVVVYSVLVVFFTPEILCRLLVLLPFPRLHRFLNRLLPIIRDN